MSKYGEFMKAKAEKDRVFFFGEGNVKKVSNQYFTFKRVLDNDNIILVTNNVKVIKESFVMIVGNNQAVYLKNWQVKQCHNFDLGLNSYLVKLNRAFFKPYTFQKDFEEVCFEKNESFDDLMAAARDQEAVNMKVALGWM